MSEEFQQILFVQFIGVLTTLVLVGIPAFSQWRKWRTGEREQVNSNSEKTDAESISIWQKTYSDLRDILVKMVRESAEQTEVIAKLTVRTVVLEGQLAAKTISEEQLQEENRELKQRVTELENTLIQERSDHSLAIQNLKDRLSKLELQQNVGTTSLSLSSNQSTG